MDCREPWVKDRPLKVLLPLMVPTVLRNDSTSKKVDLPAPEGPDFKVKEGEEKSAINEIHGFVVW